MIIHGTHPRAAASSVDTAASKPSPPAASGAASAPVAKAVEVKVSAAAKGLAQQSQSVDHAKVESLKARFVAGTYAVNHLELARAMLTSA